MFPRHYSDADLLAWHDGELAAGRRGRIAAHLEKCWSCRARLSRLDEQARRLAELAEHAGPTDADWVEQVRWRFHAVRDVAPAPYAAPAFPRRRLGGFGWRHALAGALLGTAAAAGIQGLQWIRSGSARPTHTAPPASVRSLVKPRVAAAIPSAAALPAPLKVHLPEPPALSITPREMDRADLISRRAQVCYVLHQHGACLGEAVEVTAEPFGRILVRGFLDRPQRLTALSEALAALPWVRADLRLLALEEPLEHSLLQPLMEVRSAGPLLREELESYFRAHAPETSPGAAVAALANRTVSLSENCLMDAWALRRLAAEFPPEARTEAGPLARRWIEQMIQDHAAAVAQGAGKLLTALEPLGTAPAPAPEASDAAGDIWSTAARADQLLRGLFLGGPLEGPAAEAARGALAELARLREQAGRLNLETARRNP